MGYIYKTHMVVWSLQIVILCIDGEGGVRRGDGCKVPLTNACINVVGIPKTAELSKIISRH